MLFDRQLSFRSHLRSIASKVNQRLHFFKKVAPLLNVAGKLCLYKGFVRPTMEYSFLTWMGASASSLKQLDRVQHWALRLIGPGVVLPHLSHRRMVGALCYMYKLHALHPSFASRSIPIARSCRGSPKSTHTAVFYRPSSAPAPARPPCAYCLLESTEIPQRRLEGMERATAISPAAQARAQENAGF